MRAWDGILPVRTTSLNIRVYLRNKFTLIYRGVGGHDRGHPLCGARRAGAHRWWSAPSTGGLVMRGGPTKFPGDAREVSTGPEVSARRHLANSKEQIETSAELIARATS